MFFIRFAFIWLIFDLFVGVIHSLVLLWVDELLWVCDVRRSVDHQPHFFIINVPVVLVLGHIRVTIKANASNHDHVQDIASLGHRLTEIPINIFIGFNLSQSVFLSRKQKIDFVAFLQQILGSLKNCIRESRLEVFRQEFHILGSHRVK